MRRSLMMVTILTAAFVSMPLALAGSGNGSVAVGHLEIITATELDFMLTGCNPGNVKTQGVDGYIIDMGSDTHIKVNGGSAIGPYSFNIIFYGADCGFRPGPSGFNLGQTPYRSGVFNGVGSRWAVVSLYTGVNVPFTFTTCTPNQWPFTSC